MQVKVVSVTKSLIPNQLKDVLTADEFIAYAARVSNPDNQMNTLTSPKLLAYLIKNKHWSPFEMANMCVEIKTSRAIAAQILRHRSFSFQEFSQRYSAVDEASIEPAELRTKAKTNRQSSEDVIPHGELQGKVQESVDLAFSVYSEMIEAGVAAECARMVLPLTTQTTLYMNGTVRSWIHYLEQRCDEHTQKEHREIALAIRDAMKVEFPTVYQAVWGETKHDTTEKDLAKLQEKQIEELKRLGVITTSIDGPRNTNVGSSNYATNLIQPWTIWQAWDLDGWDCDIIKRVLRTKQDQPRVMDYRKIQHICEEKIRQLSYIEAETDVKDAKEVIDG